MKARVFVSHKFLRDGQLLSLVELRAIAERAIKRAASGIENLEVEVYYEDAAFGDPLPVAIRNKIQSCHIFLCDLSVHSPNVMYELGFAHALRKRLILLCEDSKDSSIPADMRDLSVGYYSSRDGFEARLQERFVSVVNELVEVDRATLLDIDFRCSWFVGAPSDIAIICSPEPEKTRFADPKSNAFIFVDNLEDRDALLEVSMFLSRSFPDVAIHRHASDGIAHDILASDIVLLGGPRKNTVARDMLDLLGIGLTYSRESMTLTFPSGAVTLPVQHDEDGLVVLDAGYFGLFTNPFRKGKRVALCIGSHTFGTLGAVKVLDDSTQGLKNQELVKRLAAKRGASTKGTIQMLFPVSVMLNRKVPTPRLDESRIWISD